MRKSVLALGSRIKRCRNVLTLGVKVNFSDYSNYEKYMIEKANIIYYPSSFYVNLLSSYGKKVFPSCQNYDCAQDKIKQTTLFKLHGLPHPKTRFFYGKKQKQKILDYFKYPFIAKIPRGSAMGSGVFLIRNKENLEKYLKSTHVAYIQEYLTITNNIRVIVVGKRVIHYYSRVMKSGEFRSNIALGSHISLEPVPDDVLKLALCTSIRCGWDDVGIDICQSGRRLYVLEANMKYGLKGFLAAKINYYKLMEDIIDSELIGSFKKY